METRATTSDEGPIVLIVDDDADLRESLQDLFGSVGVETALFASTAELLSRGVADRPSCLVLDVRMPGASGLDLQARLAAMGAKIPIVFITGHADVHTSVRAMKAGAIDFLPKPFREQELLDTTLQALERDGERWHQQKAIDAFRRIADDLTPREVDVLRGIKRGLLNKQIAHELGIAEITVKMHRSSAGRKLKSKSLADMVIKIDMIGI